MQQKVIFDGTMLPEVMPAPLTSQVGDSPRLPATCAAENCPAMDTHSPSVLMAMYWLELHDPFA